MAEQSILKRSTAKFKLTDVLNDHLITWANQHLGYPDLDIPRKHTLTQIQDNELSLLAK